MSVMAMAAEPEVAAGPFTRGDLARMPAKAVGEAPFVATLPYPVTIVPAALVR